MSCANSVTIICLECQDHVELNYTPRCSQVIECPTCYAEMKVVSVHPLRLELYYDGDWEGQDTNKKGIWDDYSDESDVNDD